MEENFKLDKQLLLCEAHCFDHTHSCGQVASTFQHSNEPFVFVVTGGIFTLAQTALCFVRLGRMKLVKVTIFNRISVKKFLLEHS